VNTGPNPRRLRGTVESLGLISTTMYELVVRLEEALSFKPGQFCMLNLGDGRDMVLSRPFSILAADGDRVTLLFKVVGSGTRLMADCRAGATVVILGPLGRPFPSPESAEQPIRHVLLAGGVGLPPLLAWRRAWGRDGDLYFFGGRDGGDVPWPLLGDDWRCSVDRHEGVPDGSEAFTGNVVALARATLDGSDDGQCRVLTCGPLPLLRAAVTFARERSWGCYVSVEERMGCGYGVCRGCVVPRVGGAGYLTACHDGPVLAAETIDWDRFGRSERGASPAPTADCTCTRRDA